MLGGTRVCVGKVPTSSTSVSTSSSPRSEVGDGTSVGTGISSGSSVGVRSGADSDNALSRRADPVRSGISKTPAAGTGEAMPKSSGSGGCKAASGKGPTMASSSSSPSFMEVGDGLAVGTGKSTGEVCVTDVTGRE